MKIGILTHYDVNNQGAQLQLYALYMQLIEMGHEPVVLTYKKNYDFIPELEKRNQITIASVPYILKNFLWKEGISLTLHNVKKYLYNKKFREKNFIYGSYCNTVVDAAIVGADEVFSLELGANVMMYGHGVNTENMIAYAPSFGQTDLQRINKFHCKELIASGLDRFISLSARDSKTQNIIKNLTGREPEIVCDPVLLYKFSLGEINFPKGTPKRPYMVVYSYDARFRSPEEISAIKEYAHKHSLKTVSVGTFHKWCDVNIACNALQWLKCIQGAECVITDTFHGTIAAAITQRPMAVTYSKSVNSSKMLDLISRLGIEARLLNEFNYSQIESVLSKPLDKAVLNNRIELFRNKSLGYLSNSLNSIK